MSFSRADPAGAAYEPMTKQKAPKAQADALTWIRQQLIEFGIAGIPLRDLIAFVKKGLQSPNALVRSSATQVLVTIRIFVGADISGFLEDLNATLFSTINAEFENTAGETPPEPTRTSAEFREVSGGTAKAGGNASSGGDPLDDLIPRMDLDKLISQTSIITDSRSDAWKVRKEAFEALHVLLEVKSNQRLKPNMSDLGGVLKRSMGDTNLSVKMLGLNIISKVAIGMGPPFEKYAKLLVAPVAGVCADNKATTRSAGVATLNAIADGCGGLNAMYTGLGSALETSNPALRSSVLAWMAERLPVEPPTKSADMTALAAPLIACLEDRNADVRKAAGLVLPFVVASAGFDFVMDQTSNLKPASRATIVPLIEKAKVASSGSGPTASTSAPALSKRSAPAAPASPAAKARLARPNGVSSPKPGPSRNIAAPARSQALKALASSRPPSGLSGLSDVRSTGAPKSRPSTRPMSVASHAESSTTAASVSAARQMPFVSASMDSRAVRLKRDTSRWILDSSPKADMTEYLALQMEQSVSAELFTALFSKDHRAEEDFMAGLALLVDFYDDSASATFVLAEDDLVAFQLANVDLDVEVCGVEATGEQYAIRASGAWTSF